MRTIAGICALTLLIAAGCQRSDPEPSAADAAVSTVDPSGAAPPQPSPYGGDTPVGAAGPGGVSPQAAEAAGKQGDPSDPGMTAQPK